MHVVCICLYICICRERERELSSEPIASSYGNSYIWFINNNHASQEAFCNHASQVKTLLYNT